MAMPFIFFACEDQQQLLQQTPSLYGQKNTADKPYISHLNSYNDDNGSFTSNGSDISKRFNSILSGPTEGAYCTSSTFTDNSPDLNGQMTEEERAFLLSEVGSPPPPGGGVNAQLPAAGRGTSDSAKFGYYRYKDTDKIVYGTQRTVWRIKAAGKLLAEKGIEMGIGDMSKRGGGDVPNHSSHERGRDVDLRLLNSSGKATPCQVTNSSCYSVNKTFEMIKTFIDVDPTKINRIYVNDKALRDKVNEYYRSLPGNAGKGVLAKAETGHHNHVHINWKQ